MLSSLRVVNFRCWRHLDLSLAAQGGMLVGDNAQGKTSILEAMCVLLRLQSPRTHRLRSLVQLGEPAFGVAGEMAAMTRKLRYDGALRLEVQGTPRETSAQYLDDSGVVVWMGNEDLALIRGGGEGRRRFLDFIGMQWQGSYRRDWTRYRRALRGKNLLLKERHIDEAQVRAYEQVMIEAGEALAQARATLIAELNDLAQQAQLEVGGGREQLRLRYVVAGSLDLVSALGQAREREWRLRQCVVGPHRDDLELQLNGMAASEFASEGQQRTLALALKLAQGRFLENSCGVAPLYLIDDVFGELDPQRRVALLASLPQQSPLWITATSLAWLTAEERAARPWAQYRVADGAVQRVE